MGVRIKKVILTPLRSKKDCFIMLGNGRASDIAAGRSIRKTSSIYVR